MRQLIRKVLRESVNVNIHKIILHLSSHLGMLDCVVPEWKYRVNLGDWEETEIHFQVFDLDYDVDDNTGELKEIVIKVAPTDYDGVFYSKECTLRTTVDIKSKLEDYFSIPDEKVWVMFYNKAGILLRHHN
jgi:hypothetical protein